MSVKSGQLVFATALVVAILGGGRAGAQDKEKTKVTSRLSTTADKTGKPAAPKSPDAAKVAPKDQALDELLGKLGETKDEPSADERPRNRAPGEEPKEPSRHE